MKLDGHIHISGSGDLSGDERKIFLEKGSKVGISGGLVLSQPPLKSNPSGIIIGNQQRLDDLINWRGDCNRIFPFYWIDPTERDARKQVDIACSSGVNGFKIICNHFYPSNQTALETIQYIAIKNKPILFHSGILWDGTSSSRFNMPSEFEALIEIPNLRFALAHISWPWCDEHLAVYGKFLNTFSVKKEASAEMFIDISPGTPEIYRDEALTKLFTIGYDVKNNVIFGTDSFARNYNVEWAKKWMYIDDKIYSKLKLPQEYLDNIYGENLKRFLGLSQKEVSLTSPQQGI